MATLLKSKKKTKPKIIPITDDSFISDTTDQVSDQTADQNSETTRLLPQMTRVESHVVHINDPPTAELTHCPSAPPEDLYKYSPTGLANPDIRAKFMAKVYGVLFAQKGAFTIMIALFTYVPHMRKVMRKTIFDPLFMNSFIG